MFEPRILLILVPALPLIAAVATAVFGPRWLGRFAHWPTVLALTGSLLASLGLLRHFQTTHPHAEMVRSADGARVGVEEVVRLWTWADIPAAYNFPGGADQVRDLTRPISQSTGDEVLSRPFRIDVALRVDPLTIMMLLMVNFVATLVAVYGAGYMAHDRGYWRFFSYVALFVFSMDMLVTVSNFLLLFVFWEAVGVCSYLLIGFWYERPAAAAAGKKAFLVNRVGDFGFALALFALWLAYGTLNFHDTVGPEGPISGILGQTRLASGAYLGGITGLGICLCLLVGACGKSAQLPLHVWLADAMEGPTPVSALIHAATMVTAGVYLVARCTPLFMASPTAQLVVASVGAATALAAGFIALTQWDLKRVLAYSTISQLGYMFLALGTGTLAGITAGLFHLFTHAFFKALLFLGAGSVMHSMGHVIDMRRFGGLRRIMPITHATFAAGCLALAGIVPFAGFWSKDAILGAVHDQAMAAQAMIHKATPTDETSTTTGDHDHTAVTTRHLAHWDQVMLRRGAAIYGCLYYAGLVAAFMTALYTFRAYFITFHGDLKVPAEAGDHAHESPPVMWVPLAILAGFATVIGLALHRSEWLFELLRFTPSLATEVVRDTPAPGHFHWNVAVASTLVAVIGLALAAYLHLGHRGEVEALTRWFKSPWLGAPYEWSSGKLFFDPVYDWLIVRPIQGVAVLCAWADRWIVDGLVDFLGAIPRWLGGWLRLMQGGFTSSYALAMILALLAFCGARLLWGAW